MYARFSRRIGSLALLLAVAFAALGGAVAFATTHFSGFLYPGIDESTSTPSVLVEPAALLKLTLGACSGGGSTVLTASEDTYGFQAWDLPASGTVCTLTLDWNGDVVVREADGDLIATVAPSASTLTLPEPYQLEDASEETFSLLIGHATDWAAVATAAASGPLSSAQVAALTQELRQFRVVSGDAGWTLSAP